MLVAVLFRHTFIIRNGLILECGFQLDQHYGPDTLRIVRSLHSLTSRGKIASPSCARTRDLTVPVWRR